MNQSFILIFGLSALAALSSCYTWEPPPPPPHRSHHTSLDQSNRYWSGPNDGLQQIPDTLSNDLAQPQVPQEPNAPSNNYLPPTPIDPAQIQPPTNGGNNGPTVIAPTQPRPTIPPADVRPTPTGPQSGIKVPGKAGFIYSPYAKTEGLVDVQGYAPGTKVKCPYTGKTIIVP